MTERVEVTRIDDGTYIVQIEGLQTGKGVVVCENTSSALSAVIEVFTHWRQADNA